MIFGNFCFFYHTQFVTNLYLSICHYSFKYLALTKSEVKNEKKLWLIILWFIFIITNYYYT